MSSHNHVRYVGATSQIIDHRLFHVARGVSNIWTAAIVAGLGVVITGTVLYSSMHAQEVNAARVAKEADPAEISLYQLDQRLSSLEEKIQRLDAKLQQAPVQTAPPIAP